MNSRYPPTLHRLVAVTCATIGIPDLPQSKGKCSVRKTRVLSLTREIVTILARRHTGYSLAQIAKAVGYATPGAVATSVKRGHARLAANPEVSIPRQRYPLPYAVLVAAIESRLFNPASYPLPMDCAP